MMRAYFYRDMIDASIPPATIGPTMTVSLTRAPCLSAAHSFLSLYSQQIGRSSGSHACSYEVAELHNLACQPSINLCARRNMVRRGFEQRCTGGR